MFQKNPVMVFQLRIDAVGKSLYYFLLAVKD
jgi:hypothetical protein